jgi:hypothetical protein
MGAALTEYTVFCDACQEEQRNLGMVYLGSGSSDPYVVLVNRPAERAEDLSGLRLRSGKRLDADILAGQSGEAYKVLSQAYGRAVSYVCPSICTFVEE